MGKITKQELNPSLAQEIEDSNLAIRRIVLQKSENKITVFNTDGSITETIKKGDVVIRVKTITFPNDAQIVESTTENGIIAVKTTTFNTDGSIKEEVI